MKVDRKTDQEMMEANQARMEESLKEAMRLTVSAIEEKMEAIVHSIRSERDGKIQRQIENVMERQEILKKGAAVASLECEEQGAERQMVPKEEAAAVES
jgi:PDZ domain-containing secreted protein